MPVGSVTVVRTVCLSVSVIEIWALPMAPPLESETVPLTWATATAWARAADCKPGKRKIDASKDKLKNAPGFDKDHWPSMADSTWASGIHKFYGVKTTGRIQ